MSGTTDGDANPKADRTPVHDSLIGPLYHLRRLLICWGVVT
jgi:hypothetical protein